MAFDIKLRHSLVTKCRFACALIISACAGFAHGAVEQVELGFAWEPDTAATLVQKKGRERSGPGLTTQQSETALRYTMQTSQRDDGALVLRFDDLEAVDPETLAPGPIGADAAIAQALQAGGTTPDFIVSWNGTFIGLDDPATLSANRAALMREMIGPASSSPQGTQMIADVTSAEFLAAHAAATWENLVQIWVGKALEIGVYHETEGQAPHPLVPGLLVNVDNLFGLNARVPCNEDDEGNGCVELIFISEMDLDDARNAILAVIEQYTNSANPPPLEQLAKLELVTWREVVTLVTEPDSLRPHRYRLDKTVAMQDGDDATTRAQQSEFERIHYSYRSLAAGTSTD